MSLSGHVFCLSGALPSGISRSQKQELLIANGASIAKTVTSKVTHLLVADPMADTSKIRKAQKAGVIILDEQGVDLLMSQTAVGSKRTASTLSSSKSKSAKSIKTKAGATASSSLSSSDKPFSSFKFCITGTMKSMKKVEFSQKLLDNGAVACSVRVTRDVTHLIVPTIMPEKLSTGSKVVAARKSPNCQIVTEKWILERWNMNATSSIASTSSSSSSSGSSSSGGGGGGGGAKDPSVFPIKACMLAQKYDPSKHAEKVLGWYVSEKLDGLRAVWSGRQFFSRSKKDYQVPAEFCAEFPTDVVLDGELNCGPGGFDTSTSIVRTGGTNYARWLSDNMIFSVFDAPLLGGEGSTFEERIALLTPMLAGKKHIVLCKQQRVTSAQHIQDELKSVVAKNGEGLMLRDPASAYAFKRVSTLLKVKMMHDAEALVIGHDPGKGSNTGKCGALICRMPSGCEFNCGSGMNDANRCNPPPVGTTITYQYFEITPAGKPRFPSFVRVYVPN